MPSSSGDQGRRGLVSYTSGLGSCLTGLNLGPPQKVLFPKETLSTFSKLTCKSIPLIIVHVITNMYSVFLNIPHMLLKKDV